MKVSGRRCGSVCCTGGLLVETMLSVLVDTDLDQIDFTKRAPTLSQGIYRDKPYLSTHMYFDLNLVLKAYVDALDREPAVVPYLNSLDLTGTHYGTVRTEMDRNRVMAQTAESGAYTKVSNFKVTVLIKMPPLLTSMIFT